MSQITRRGGAAVACVLSVADWRVLAVVAVLLLGCLLVLLSSRRCTGNAVRLLRAWRRR